MQTLMRRAILLAVLCAAIGVAARATARVKAEAARDEKPPTAVLIAALDDCIQERFKDVDQSFGIRRIIPPGISTHRFNPETVREVAAVGDLERAGLRVVLYLTGRQILQPEPNRASLSDEDTWRLVKGPILVTPAPPANPAASSDHLIRDRSFPLSQPRADSRPAVETREVFPYVPNPAWHSARAEGVPHPLDLWQESQRAMLAFGNTAAREFRIADWNMTARPVRASDAACLRCHQNEGVYLGSGRGPSPLQIGDPLGVVLYGSQPLK